MASERCRLASAVAVVLTATAMVGAPGPAHTTASAAAVSSTPVAPGLAVNEVTPVPADGVLHLRGHGFGSGVGLSQWGAQGGAESGANAATILTRYYPGSTLTPSAPAPVRVLLSGLAAGGVSFRNTGGLTVTGADGVATLPAQDAPHSWLRLVPAVSGLALQYSADGATWTPQATVAAPATVTAAPVTAATVNAATVAAPAAVLRVRARDGSLRSYRGSLVVSPAGQVVDVLALEDYLRGVLPQESPPSWLAAALQAQAVAARTYAAYLTGRAAPGSGYDICDTSACQVYGGATVETASTDAAVAATAGQEMTRGGTPIEARYGASDGGYSVDGGQPYLSAAPDPWDGVDPANASHLWTATITAAQLQARYPAVGTLTGLTVTRRDGNGDDGGRVLSLVLTGVLAGHATAVTTSGSDVVNAHAWPAAGDGLRSSWWTVAGQTVDGVSAPTSPASATIGIAPVTPFRAIETSHLGTTARRIRVAGAQGIPAGASAVFVVASLGRLSHGWRADLVAWPSGGNRSGAVAVARLSESAPTSGSALVRLGPDGSFDVAATSGSAGLELSVTGWAGTAAPTGVQLVAAAPTLLRASVGRGTRLLGLPKAPPGAVAALVAVTGSTGRPAMTGSAGRPASGRSAVGTTPKAGVLLVGGVPTQTLGTAPQTTTVLLPVSRASLRLTQDAGATAQLLAWLTPTGVRLTALRSGARPAVPIGTRGGLIHVAGNGVPARARMVVALLTETAAKAGELSAYPHGPASHGAASRGAAVAVPAGRATTTLVTFTSTDGLLVVRPPAGGAKVALVVLGYAGPPGADD